MLNKWNNNKKRSTKNNNKNNKESSACKFVKNFYNFLLLISFCGSCDTFKVNRLSMFDLYSRRHTHTHTHTYMHNQSNTHTAEHTYNHIGAAIRTCKVFKSIKPWKELKHPQIHTHTHTYTNMDTCTGTPTHTCRGSGRGTANYRHKYERQHNKWAAWPQTRAHLHT